MPFQADGNLYIYVLNVGQADTTVIVTPQGNCIIIDAKNPRKLANFLEKINQPANKEISELIITHPHKDHFSGANRIIKDYKISGVKLSPFWNNFGLGPPQYQTIVERVVTKEFPVHFVSGYSRIYPDGTPISVKKKGAWVDPDTLYVELLGPSNNLLEILEESDELDGNHLSIMARLSWKNFRMVFAGDAQMENWSYFDQEGMLEEKCYILKTAHHGSCNGTQWERINRLKPMYTIVSSDPTTSHQLPDLIGTSIFAKYSLEESYWKKDINNIVALTSETGTIKITVTDAGDRIVEYLDEKADEDITTNMINNPKPLTWDNNPTDWEAILDSKADKFYE